MEDTAFKTFLKSLPVLLTFLGFEFIVYFFIMVSFNNDFSSIMFFKKFPLVIRIPLFIAFFFSSIILFRANDFKHVFLAIFLNVLFAIFFFEVYVFQSIRNPFIILWEFLVSLYNNVCFFFKEIL